MPFYHRLGAIPRKRHTQFRDPSGGLYHEELIGNEGFSGLSSLLYHAHPPTQVIDLGSTTTLAWQKSADPRLRHRHMRTGRLVPSGDALTGRRPLLYNREVALSLAVPAGSQEYFYRNGQGDEIVFVDEGQGTIETTFGDLPYRKGDYVVIPRATIHRWRCDAVAHRLLVIESRGPVRTPHRYRNRNGQLLEHSPYCERDIRRPERLQTHLETGSFEVRIKQGDSVHAYVYASHPLDVVGWDGYYYPWILNIADFEPITGRIHQPPPVHQTFEGDGFVVCSFVPRLFDYHPDAIPVPYHHTNVGSDEVIYYASDRFMSRRGIERGSITHHPDGLTHGPHPGTIEQSLGARGTDELAVMVDTFSPLDIARDADEIDDPDYPLSWTTTDGHGKR